MYARLAKQLGEAPSLCAEHKSIVQHSPVCSARLAGEGLPVAIAIATETCGVGR